MPKLTENIPTGTGTTTTGKAYEPAVTPNARDDDDSRVIGARNSGRDRMEHGQYGRDEEDRRTGAASGHDQRDVINEDSLQAGYGGPSNPNRHDDNRTPSTTWDNQVRTRHNPHGDFDPQKRHPWQTTYTGNADRPYGAERYENEGRSTRLDGGTRTQAERDLDDRTRYADGSHKDDDRTRQRRDEERDRDYETNRRDNGRNANEFGTGNTTRNR